MLFPQSFKTILLLTMLASIASNGNAQNLNDSIADKNNVQHRLNLHFQTTYIYQYKPAFSAPYSGGNSLLTNEERENSITATLYFGARLWKGAELYINPEVAGGSGLSSAFGLAASTNGETFRVGDPEPGLYLARGYFSQTLAIGEGLNPVAEGANETGGMKPANYIKCYLGKLSLADIFDINAYANSPKTQFMNWCLMNNGAWDFAANTRGYTYAFAAVLQYKNMAYKAALATLPVTANGMELNTNLSEEHGFYGEIDRAYTLQSKRTGNIRLLGYYNSGHMGNYREALMEATTIPYVTGTRAFGRTKVGIGISFDQQVSAATGIFARAGWNDGKNETWAFTEADQSVSAGISVSGSTWKRRDDNLSFAIVANGLSVDHKDYLSAGGLGFQIGDGKLNYANETAAELYYNYKPTSSGIWLTADYQFILNPGYNKDRGPVNVVAVRVHVEL